MSQFWEAEYDRHRIRVENDGFAERLIVDGVVQDSHKGLTTRYTLRGEIRTESGSGASVRAELNEGRDEGVACQIFVAGQLLYSSANSRRS